MGQTLGSGAELSTAWPVGTNSPWQQLREICYNNLVGCKPKAERGRGKWLREVESEESVLPQTSGSLLKLGIVVRTFNPSTCEEEAGGFL